MCLVICSPSVFLRLVQIISTRLVGTAAESWSLCSHVIEAGLKSGVFFFSSRSVYVSVFPCVVRGVSLLHIFCCLPCFRRRSAGREARVREVTSVSLTGLPVFSVLPRVPIGSSASFLSQPSCSRLFVGLKKKKRKRKTVIISVGFLTSLGWLKEDLFCSGFWSDYFSFLFFVFFFSLGAPFGQYRTAEQRLDEPPCWNPEMELLLICLSLWILQCNSARADSIIHIGKRPIRQHAVWVRQA